MTTTLTAEEKTLLKQIMDDKFAAGPFCGMVFNSLRYHESDGHVFVERHIAVRIKAALQVRLVAQGMAK